MTSVLPVGNQHVRVPQEANLRLAVPWWVNPLWAIILLPGTMAVVAVAIPEESYAEWVTRKFLDSELSVALLVLFLSLTIGVLFAAGVSTRTRTIDITVTQRQVYFLDRAYKILVVLSAIGYGVWVGSAIAQGVGFSTVLAVLERSQGAIGELKSNARPIGGITTLTQFAPVAVALNILLWRLGVRHLPSLALLFAAALLRVFFYAERLALIELIVPAAVIGALILSANSRWRGRLAIGPALAVPVIWAVFAVSEYFRSWVYYQKQTDMPFVEWVTLRLIGYYVTAYNNSALVADAYKSDSPLPWYSLQWFWNFPGIDAALTHPGISGLPADEWWTATLTSNANINFTNTGSFLTTYAEFGLPISVVIWLGAGIAFGMLFNALSRGSLPALLLYATLFVGLLELPRIMYWTLGRSTPIFIACAVLAYQWAKLIRDEKRQAPAVALTSWIGKRSAL